MWGFAWMFWMVPLFFCFAMMRRRRWERWAMAQGNYRGGHGGSGSGLQREVESQRTYIEELEHRIAQLEEKLDFTERLVTGRRDE
jgi:hypothetical protein